jgi:acyl carrier protein
MVAKRGDRSLLDEVRAIVADVLVVAPERVGPDTAIVEELGAESIDFLDLIFRLEQSLGVRIPVERWDAYVRGNLATADVAAGITPTFIAGFAEATLSKRE